MWFPLASICGPSCLCFFPPILPSLLVKLLLIGLDIKDTLHLLWPPLSTLFSWLCGYWGEALDEFLNTFLPIEHSNYGDGKSLGTVWTSWDSNFLLVPLILLLYWKSLLILVPSKTFNLVAYGLLLSTRCLMMDFLFKKWASLWISIV